MIGWILCVPNAYQLADSSIDDSGGFGVDEIREFKKFASIGCEPVQIWEPHSQRSPEICWQDIVKVNKIDPPNQPNFHCLGQVLCPNQRILPWGLNESARVIQIYMVPLTSRKEELISMNEWKKWEKSSHFIYQTSNIAMHATFQNLSLIDYRHFSVTGNFILSP